MACPISMSQMEGPKNKGESHLDVITKQEREKEENKGNINALLVIQVKVGWLLFLQLLNLNFLKIKLR